MCIGRIDATDQRFEVVPPSPGAGAMDFTRGYGQRIRDVIWSGGAE